MKDKVLGETLSWEKASASNDLELYDLLFFNLATVASTSNLNAYLGCMTHSKMRPVKRDKRHR